MPQLKTVKTPFNDDNILKRIVKDYHFSKCYLLLIFVRTILPRGFH